MITIFSLGFKGYHVLSQIHESYINLIDFVVIGQDKGVIQDFAEETKLWCQSKGIQWLDRMNFQPSIKNSNYWLMLGWKWLVTPPNGTQLIVLHDSLLPKYRGFNPLVTALIEGDSIIGATAIFGNEEFDRGAIIFQKSVEVDYPIKIQDAIIKIAFLYAEIVGDILDIINKRTPLPSKLQKEEEATYSLWRDEEDYRIDWNQDASKIIRHIYASGSPYQGAFTTYKDSKYRIMGAQIFEDVHIINRTPGKVIFRQNGHPVVVCGKGLLVLKEIIDETGVKVLFPTLRLRFV